MTLFTSQKEIELMATHIDPVCGMKVDDQKAAAQSKHEGKTYYFCSQGCKSKFDQNPQQYASQKPAS
jgi:Cu+-exporting ATPase